MLHTRAERSVATVTSTDPSGENRQPRTCRRGAWGEGGDCLRWWRVEDEDACVRARNPHSIGERASLQRRKTIWAGMVVLRKDEGMTVVDVVAVIYAKTVWDVTPSYMGEGSHPIRGQHRTPQPCILELKICAPTKIARATTTTCLPIGTHPAVPVDEAGFARVRTPPICTTVRSRVRIMYALHTRLAPENGFPSLSPCSCSHRAAVLAQGVLGRPGGSAPHHDARSAVGGHRHQLPAARVEGAGGHRVLVLPQRAPQAPVHAAPHACGVVPRHRHQGPPVGSKRTPLHARLAELGTCNTAARESADQSC